MATNDIGRVTPIWRGFYSAAATYELNDIVIDTAGSVWWHKGHDITVGTDPAEGDVWGAVIDMGVFGASIREAIETAQAAVAAAQEAVAEVTADTERAETAADNAEISAQNAASSAADVGAYAQAAEAAKNAAQTAQSGAEAAKTAAQTAQSGAEAARTAAQTAKTGAEAARTGAETAQAAAEAAQANAEAVAGSIEEDATLIRRTAAETDVLQGAALEVGAIAWQQGAISSSQGLNTNTTTRIRTVGVLPETAVQIEPAADGYQYVVFCYDAPEAGAAHYTGAWNGAEFAKNSTNIWQTGMIDLGALKTAATSQDGAAEHWFRVVLAYLDNAEITPDAGSALAISLSRIAEAEKAVDPMQSAAGIPVLELVGDTTGMSKDNAVNLSYTLFGNDANIRRTGTCSVKWQGSSSVRYPKHNFTVKFDNKFDAWRLWQGFLYDYYNSTNTGTGDNRERDTLAQNWTKPVVIPDSVPEGWGEQKKFCFKANWIDASHLRNIVCARLWGEMAASRGAREYTTAIADKRADAPNWGAIDGFPTIITINGEFAGLYTFNIPKDGWTFAMGEGASEYVVCGEGNANRMTQWRPANAQSAVAMDGTDYSLEYPDEEDVPGATAAAAASLTAAIQSVRGCVPGTEDWKTAVGAVLDVDSVFDYFIHALCTYNNDGFARNILYGTYDGEKWFLSAYDMDSTFGFDPYGSRVFHVEPQDFNATAMTGERASLANASIMNGLANLAIHDPTFQTRYRELREGILSDAHVLEALNGLGVYIQDPVYSADRKRWPSMPASASHNIAEFMNFYREHCAFLDREAGIAGETDSATPVIASAAGYPLEIADAAEGRKFRAVRVPFGPVIAGSGNPSPSNIRKLSPRTPTLRLCGPNLHDAADDTPDMGYNADGEIAASTSGTKISGHIPVAGNSSVTMLIWGQPAISNRPVRAGAYDAGGTMLNGGALIYSATHAKKGYSITQVSLPVDTATIRVSLDGGWNLAVYAATGMQTIPLNPPAAAGDIYGGIWEPTAGTLAVDRAFMSFDGTENWNVSGTGTASCYFRLNIGVAGSVVDGSGICSHFAPVQIGFSTTDVGQYVVNSAFSNAIIAIRPENAASTTLEDFKAWLAAQAAAQTPVQVAYKIAQPTAYEVTAEDLTERAGVNTLFSDAWEYGEDCDVSADYAQETGAAIEAAASAVRALIAEAQTATASRALTAGEYITAGGILYKVTADVAQGEALTPGVNVAETTVGEELAALRALIVSGS